MVFLITSALLEKEPQRIADFAFDLGVKAP